MDLQTTRRIKLEETDNIEEAVGFSSDGRMFKAFVETDKGFVQVNPEEMDYKTSLRKPRISMRG